MLLKEIILFVFFSIFAGISLAQENTPILCADGIDNDGDGLIDCEDNNCATLTITNGCELCKNDGSSFADAVIEYKERCTYNQNDNPQAALGAPNYNMDFDGSTLSLTEGGSVKLSFTDNLIVNSGNSDPDIWIFEAGTLVEACNIELKPFDQSTIDILNMAGITDSNNDGFYEFGGISGAAAAIDIDAVVGGYVSSMLKFDAIQIIDIEDTCTGSSPGADIDAVCALSSIEVDCAGVNSGNSIIDECGECLEPNSLAFNQSCADCAGVPNGNFILDDCNECLAPTDSLLNLSCIDEKIFIPNAFSPNNDGINDLFEIYSENPSIEIKNYIIYNRWGQQIYAAQNFNITDNSYWWKGAFKNNKQPLGVFTYFIEVVVLGKPLQTYKGSVTLVR